VSLSVSESEVIAGSGVTITWSGPAGSTCTKIGGTGTSSSTWTGTTTTSGSENMVMPAGIYMFGLSCTDADDGNEATPPVVRVAFVGVSSDAPALEPVDGGGGAGALSLAWLLLAAALLYLKNLKEKRSSCP
jgi:hypothetical protein